MRLNVSYDKKEFIIQSNNEFTIIYHYSHEHAHDVIKKVEKHVLHRQTPTPSHPMVLYEPETEEDMRAFRYFGLIK
jgi:hypothetical protein